MYRLEPLGGVRGGQVWPLRAKGSQEPRRAPAREGLTPDNPRSGLRAAK
jgi:hypothetical protein